DRFLGMNSGSVIIGTGSEWSPATFTINQWQHVALVYTASDVRFYLNGVEHYTTTAQSLGMTTSKFLIGCRNSPIAEFAAAQFDEVRVWNTARTQCEIQTYMNAEITSTASGLVANYHFNQGIPSGSNTAVTSLTDAAGSNTGTLTSFVLTGSVSNWVSPGGVISGSTTPAPPTSSILVSGNSNSITPGSTVTSTLNFTDFGTAVTRTFVIQNSNLGVLNIASPYFTGTNAADFLVTTLPSESLAASATTSFVITFSPSANGVKNATLNISNNSCGIPLFNCAITATPPTASGLSFSGASNYVSVSGHTLNGQSFTIEFYAQRTSTLTNDFIYGQGVSTTNGGLHIGFYDHSISDNLVFDFWNDAISATNSDFNWHHWACVYDASAPAGAKNRFIYRDGVIAAMDTYTGTYTGTGTSYIGTTPWSIVGDAFEGNLDEMRVWSIARSQCEIQTYMNCEIPAAAPGLISNYHFNQGSPGLNNSGINTLVDVSSTPHTGTLSGFALTGSVSNWISPSAIALNYTNTAVPNASFVISGNGNNVPVGATTSTTNFTDFGTNTTRTFVIANPGSAPLYVNTGYVTGANASNFIVTATPGSVIAGGSSDNLVITFSPTALGTASAILNIVSSDCTYPTYS
ncbi:MAG: choice-of-anchor D domain-containing protein, partial [Bacteroidia bacterium]|nr:choice-of-anchor D domain-containing protein [Bacteroidia bacterium]